MAAVSCPQNKTYQNKMINIPTVQGRVVDAFNNPFKYGRIQFIPQNPPAIISPAIEAGNIKSLFLDVNGQVTTSLFPASYQVVISNNTGSCNTRRPVGESCAP